MGTYDNIAFRHIEHFEEIIQPGSHESYIPIPIPLEDLIPDDPSTFFRYDGSLTTPECNESVIWTVFQTPISISERQVKSTRIETNALCVNLLRYFYCLFLPFMQLEKLKEVFDTHNHPLVDNYRPVQPLSNRNVMYRTTKI